MIRSTKSTHQGLILISGTLLILMLGVSQADPHEPTVSLVKEAVFALPDSVVQEVTTAELEQILETQSALVLDARPPLEWAISHIPGALNVGPKPGVDIALYSSDVAEVGRLVKGNTSQPLVLYCNGPYCGKSKRVTKQLIEVGYSDVRIYQLGAPVWRALVGVMEIEPDGVNYVSKSDQTAVWVDVRDTEFFQEESLPGARNIPRNKVLPGKDVGEIFAAKQDGRLPMKDHNTRIIVFGQDGEQARTVAEAVAREAFHNVSYFSGTYDAMMKSISGQTGKSESDRSASNDEKAVTDAEDEWIRAEIERDEATLRRIIDDRFVLNSNSGQTSGKEALIEGVLSWNMTGQIISERSVLIEGDTAMIFGTTELRFSSEGNEDTASLLRYTTTYIKRHGQWRAIGLHMAKRTTE
jgi:rhodanese-related sulfurtransferase/ketosteroid isomerase-like protein